MDTNLFLNLLIIFLSFQLIISDEKSDNFTCSNAEIDNCLSTRLSSENSMCCLVEKTGILDEAKQTTKGCFFSTLDSIIEVESYYTKAFSAASKEIRGIGEIKDEFPEKMLIYCKDRTILYDVELSEDDKKILHSEDSCLCFYYKFCDGETLTKDSCKNKKLTKSSIDAGLECAYFTMINKISGETSNFCFLLNSDIFTTKKLNFFIEDHLTSNKYIKVKEIFASNGGIIKFNGENTEIIEGSNQSNEEKNIKYNFILLILFIILNFKIYNFFPLFL